MSYHTVSTLLAKYSSLKAVVFLRKKKRKGLKKKKSVPGFLSQALEASACCFFRNLKGKKSKTHFKQLNSDVSFHPGASLGLFKDTAGCERSPPKKIRSILKVQESESWKEAVSQYHLSHLHSTYCSWRHHSTLQLTVLFALTNAPVNWKIIFCLRKKINKNHVSLLLCLMKMQLVNVERSLSVYQVSTCFVLTDSLMAKNNNCFCNSLLPSAHTWLWTF